MRTSPEVGECDSLRGTCCAVGGASSGAGIGLRLSHDDVGGISIPLIRTAPVPCVGFKGERSDER